MKLGKWLLSALLFVGLTGQARATPILDQSFTGPANVALSFGQGTQVAQSFTVGLTGNLTEVDVSLERPQTVPGGNILFDIRSAPLGVPQLSDTPVLASGSVAIASTPASAGFVSLTGFSIPVVAGDQLAIVLTTDQTSFSEAWLFSNGANSYTRGEGYARNSSPSNQAWFDQSGDFLFKTFVDPAIATPEPSTLTLSVMMASGLAGYFGWRRRKQVATA